MRFVAILANFASIGGLVGTVYQLLNPGEAPVFAKWLIFGVLAFGLSFYLYVYLRPGSVVAGHINSRLDFSGRYGNSKNESIDIVEDILSVDCQTWGTTVLLPPFEDAPIVTLARDGGQGGSVAPTIVAVTSESFVVAIHSSAEAGKWRWRARGRLLTPTQQRRSA